MAGAATNTGVTFEQPPGNARPASPRPSIRAGTGAVVGIVTALVSLGVAQLIAAILSSPIGAPVSAVGELSIDHTPPAVKNFAISTFGSHDKTVLVWGIRVVLILFAIALGIAALRKLWFGFAGFVILGAIGVYAALSQPSAHGTDALPSIIGAVAGCFALRYFVRLANRRPADAAAEAAADHEGAADHEADRGFDRRAGDGAGARPEPGRGPAAPGPGPAEPGRGPAAAGGWRERDPRRAPPPPEPDRRRFLLASSAFAGASLLTYAAGSWLAESRDVTAIEQALKLPAAADPAPPLPPGTDFHIRGLASFITPNSSFYRVDTALVLPEVDPSHWQLRIHGMVNRELVLSFDELLKRPLIEDYVTLCCVSNPVGGPYIGNAKWLGASLGNLLREAGIKAGADQLYCTSSDGFTSGTPVATAMDGRDALVAVAMNGSPLPVQHGFPARLVIPGLYGYVSACKWVVDIEVTTYAANTAYWAQRGWSAQAPIKTESRIDVPTGQNPVKAGLPVTIAGVAWAQHKGIEAVEVRAGGGGWHQARLAAVPGIDTWRQWAYDWTAPTRPGTYLIEARATDKTGYTQTALAEPPEPNGASGYPAVQISVQ